MTIMGNDLIAGSCRLYLEFVEKNKACSIRLVAE